MKPLELAGIVEGPPRYDVDEGLRSSAIGRNDLVRLGLDVMDCMAVAEIRKRNSGYRRSVDQGSCLAKNAVHGDRVIGGDGQIAMRLKRSPPGYPAAKQNEPFRRFEERRNGLPTDPLDGDGPSELAAKQCRRNRAGVSDQDQIAGDQFLCLPIAERHGDLRSGEEADSERSGVVVQVLDVFRSRLAPNRRHSRFACDPGTNNACEFYAADGLLSDNMRTAADGGRCGHALPAAWFALRAVFLSTVNASISPQENLSFEV